MGLIVAGVPIVDDAFQLQGLLGFDSAFVTRCNEVFQADNHTFTVYNSSGTAIRTIYFLS